MKNMSTIITLYISDDQLLHHQNDLFPTEFSHECEKYREQLTVHLTNVYDCDIDVVNAMGIDVIYSSVEYIDREILYDLIDEFDEIYWN